MCKETVYSFTKCLHNTSVLTACGPKTCPNQWKGTMVSRGEFCKGCMNVKQQGRDPSTVEALSQIMPYSYVMDGDTTGVDMGPAQGRGGGGGTAQGQRPRRRTVTFADHVDVRMYEKRED